MCMHATNIDHNHLRTFPFQKYKCMTISEQMWKPCMVRERFKHFVNQDDAQHQAMHDAEMWIVDCFHIFSSGEKRIGSCIWWSGKNYRPDRMNRKSSVFFREKRKSLEVNGIASHRGNDTQYPYRYGRRGEFWEGKETVITRFGGQRGIPRNMYCSI